MKERLLDLIAKWRSDSADRGEDGYGAVFMVCAAELEAAVQDRHGVLEGESDGCRFCRQWCHTMRHGNGVVEAATDDRWKGSIHRGFDGVGQEVIDFSHLVSA